MLHAPIPRPWIAAFELTQCHPIFTRLCAVSLLITCIRFIINHHFILLLFTRVPRASISSLGIITFRLIMTTSFTQKKNDQSMRQLEQNQYQLMEHHSEMSGWATTGKGKTKMEGLNITIWCPINHTEANRVHV